MSFIVTSTGRKFYPLNPSVDNIHVIDIANALSKQGRWTGHTLGAIPYTVAQHAVLCSQKLDHDPMLALEALHHDSSEAYLVDVARPLKSTPGFKEVYMEAEARLMKVIYEAFGIKTKGTEGMSPEVKEVDNRMLVTEYRDLMHQLDANDPDVDWYKDVAVPYCECLDVWSSQKARRMFIDRHYYLSRRSQAHKWPGYVKPFIKMRCLEKTSKGHILAVGFSGIGVHTYQFIVVIGKERRATKKENR